MEETRSWWTTALRGLLAIAAGLFFIFFPVGTIRALVYIFGTFAIAAGVFAFIGGLVGLTKKQGGWTLLLEGALGVAAGAIVFAWPAITSAIFLFVIGAWAVVVGAVELVRSFRARVLPGAWLLAAGGAFTLLFGIVLLVTPTASVLAISWLLGVFLLASGFVQLALGLSLRRPFARQAI